MWCHSCICLEGQRKFTEDICEEKLSPIPDLNSGSSHYESVVPRLGRNFLFTLDLFGFCVMLLTRDICHYTIACHVMGHHIFHMLLLIASVGLLPSAFAALCYMLDAEQFPQRQFISHGEHFVSIMKTLSLAFVCCSQSTESASAIINIDSGV